MYCFLYWSTVFAFVSRFSQLREYFLNTYDLDELVFTAIKGTKQHPCLPSYFIKFERLWL